MTKEKIGKKADARGVNQTMISAKDVCFCPRLTQCLRGSCPRFDTTDGAYGRSDKYSVHIRRVTQTSTKRSNDSN